MKVIIAGSRGFLDYNKLCSVCDSLLKDYKDIEIVSGTANGADKLGEKYARTRGYLIKRFPADWDTYGKSAGYVRNREMAKYADFLIAFWNGDSVGTKHMINSAKYFKLEVEVIYS